MLVAGLDCSEATDPNVANEAELDDGDALLRHILKQDGLDSSGQGKHVHEEYCLPFAVLHYLLSLRLRVFDDPIIGQLFLLHLHHNYLAFSRRIGGQRSVTFQRLIYSSNLIILLWTHPFHSGK